MMEKETQLSENYFRTDLVARAKTWPVAWLRMSQSRRIPFFPDAPTHVSISTTSPLHEVHRSLTLFINSIVNDDDDEPELTRLDIDPLELAILKQPR